MLKVLMRRSRLATGSFVFLTLLLPALPIEAQQPVGASVKIVSNGPNIYLQTIQNVALSAVLQEFCDHTQAACEGAAAAAGIELPPTSVFGTWEQVVTKLMEGTGLNYVTMAPTDMSGGRLLVTGFAFSSEATSPIAIASGWVPCLLQPSSSQAGQIPSDCAAGTSVSLERQSEVPASDVPFSTPQSPVIAAVPDRAELLLTAASRLPVAGTESGDSPSQTPAESASSAVLPFPDSSGHPIPLNHELTTFLPFPDSRGNPIPISSEQNQPQYMPFPDGHGNPMPVSEQTAQYLPFPDSKGIPIPVRSGVPQ